MQAIHSTRPGGHVGYVGVTHDVALPGDELFFSDVHLHGGPAPVRRFLPDLIDRIWDRKIDPGKVFDLDPPARRGRRRLPGDGRAPRHQGPAPPCEPRRVSETSDELEQGMTATSENGSFAGKVAFVTGAGAAWAAPLPAFARDGAGVVLPTSPSRAARRPPGGSRNSAAGLSPSAAT